MKQPHFTHSELRHVTSRSIYDRALDLFKKGEVGSITESIGGYSAIVKGTKSYRVNLPISGVDYADCSCYMGQNEQLCKHVLALGLKVLEITGNLDDSKSTKELADLEKVKLIVREGIKKIKPYRGPSRIWFRYQRDLSMGAGMIEDAVAGLPPTKENVKYIWSLVIRLDRKLSNGVDDSDGTVGACISCLVEQLYIYAKENSELLLTIEQFCADKTNYDFHLMLEGLIDELKC